MLDQFEAQHEAHHQRIEQAESDFENFDQVLNNLVDESISIIDDPNTVNGIYDCSEEWEELVKMPLISSVKSEEERVRLIAKKATLFENLLVTLRASMMESMEHEAIKKIEAQIDDRSNHYYEDC